MMENTAGESLRTVTENTDKTEQIPNFDQTLRIDDVENLLTPQNLGQKTEVLPAPDSAPQQSNVKTEVFGGDFGAAEYLEKNETTTPPQNFVTDDFSAKTDENIAPPSNFTGDKTVSFIEANKQNPEIDLAHTQPASAFNSVPQVENFGATAETRLPTEGFSQTNEQAIPQTPPAPAPNYDSKPKQWQAQPAPVQPKQKKSKGLLFGILGALFGLVILAAAGGGIAWYLMNQQGISDATNTATPSPEPSIMQTPAPTPEQEANANTGNTSNSEVVTTNSPDNSNVNTAAPSPEQTKTVVTQQTPVTTKTVTTRPTQVTTNTPRTTTPKPTVKPEVKPTLRGKDIPQ
jgi:flagellar basal body-associated protein FliL